MMTDKPAENNEMAAAGGGILRLLSGLEAPFTARTKIILYASQVMAMSRFLGGRMGLGACSCGSPAPLKSPCPQPLGTA